MPPSSHLPLYMLYLRPRVKIIGINNLFFESLWKPVRESPCFKMRNEKYVGKFDYPSFRNDVGYRFTEIIIIMYVVFLQNRGAWINYDTLTNNLEVIKFLLPSSPFANILHTINHFQIKFCLFFGRARISFNSSRPFCCGSFLRYSHN